MTPVKASNAVLAVADLLSVTVAEYEQRLAEKDRALAEKDRALGAVAAQLMQAAERDGLIFRRLVALQEQTQTNNFESTPPDISAKTVSEWLSELQEWMSPSAVESSGGRNKLRT